MPISSSRYYYDYTAAETADYPDFYHWIPNVAEDTTVARQENVLLALLISKFIVLRKG